MLYVFIAETTAVLAYREAYAMTRGAIIGARVFGVESLNGVPAFYTDWHCRDLLVSSEHGWFGGFQYQNDSGLAL